RIGFSASDSALERDAATGSFPRSPLTGDGRTVDSAAVPLSPEQKANSDSPNWRVADPREIPGFTQRNGYLRVEREGSIVRIEGVVEAIYDPYEVSCGTVAIKLPTTVHLRCTGSEVPIEGDSGAPLLAVAPGEDTPTLLGFHVVLLQAPSDAAH